MPSSRDASSTTRPPGYRSLLADREFRALYLTLAGNAAAAAGSGFALGTVVDRQTGSPLLTALSLYGSTFATVVGALTVMSLADGDRPRRSVVRLQVLAVACTVVQAVPGLPVAVRFGLLVVLGFVESLGTGARLGLLAEVVPPSAYALARSLLNITMGLTSIVGFAAASPLLRVLTPSGVFLVAAGLVAAGVPVLATGVRARSARPGRRPGLRPTWGANVALLRAPGQRALLVNLWVPNGLIVGCEALFIPYDPGRAGFLLAAGSAGMLLGDLTVGRLLSAAVRARAAFPLRIALAVPYLLFAVRPPLWLAWTAVLGASAGFAATLPLQEQLLALVPAGERGQVQGVESAGRLTWQGLGAALAGIVAEQVGPAAAMTVLAVASLAVSVVSRPMVRRAVPVPEHGLGKTYIRDPGPGPE